jgi:hypothetical protein
MSRSGEAAEGKGAKRPQREPGVRRRAPCHARLTIAPGLTHAPSPVSCVNGDWCRPTRITPSFDGGPALVPSLHRSGAAVDLSTRTHPQRQRSRPRHQRPQPHPARGLTRPRWPLHLSTQRMNARHAAANANPTFRIRAERLSTQRSRRLGNGVFPPHEPQPDNEESAFRDDRGPPVPKSTPAGTAPTFASALPQLVHSLG